MSVCEFRRDSGYVAGIGLGHAPRGASYAAVRSVVSRFAATKWRLLGEDVKPGHVKAF
jgi:hypothetical protein